VNERRSGRGTLRSFLFGGVVGGVLAAGAAARVRRGPRGRPEPPRPIAGLEAFEGAPCWQYDRRRSGAQAESPPVDSRADA